MDAVFADDSGQPKPTRKGMGKLVAVGGLHVPSAAMRALEGELDALCAAFGFPPEEEFKWSPDKKTWMQKELVQERRADFFHKALDAATRYRATAIVTIADTGGQTGNRSVQVA